MNLLLALKHASFTLILCVSPCQQDYTRNGNMKQKLIGLNLNKTNRETLRIWLCHISKDKRLSIKMRVSALQELRKKIDCSRVDGFFAHCNTVFQAMGRFHHYRPCEEARPPLTEEDIERGNKKREIGPDEKAVHQKKDIVLFKCGNVNGGISIRRHCVLKNH